jgi:hypothetical protein
VTNDAPLPWGLVRPNFLSLWLSPPGVFSRAFFFTKIFWGKFLPGVTRIVDGALDEQIGGGSAWYFG